MKICSLKKKKRSVYQKPPTAYIQEIDANMLDILYTRHVPAAQFGRLVAFTYFYWSSLDSREGLSSLFLTHEGLNPAPQMYIQEMGDINFIFLSAQQQVYL